MSHTQTQNQSTPTATVAVAVIPRATYRLQLHKDFGFEAATTILPYLQRLGVSHVYCSPISRARPGSLHGYDVVDHREINPELGGQEGFERFAAAARAHGLGLVLDLVPNHMGVIGAHNPWWADVLENGQASGYAGFFDINWHPFNEELVGKVLIPVLGEAYGEVLAQGQLQLAFDAAAGQFQLAYFSHRFPVDPHTWPVLLDAALAELEAAGGDASLRARFIALSAYAAALPDRSEVGEAARNYRADVIAPLKQQLAELAGEADAAGAIERVLATVNGAEGHDELHRLHEAQAYRLASWLAAADEINYRRFFDVNELAALRIEDERVFEATHALALDLTASGVVDGLRIDHPDGLRDPAQYFERLQRGHARRLAQRLPDAATPVATADAQALGIYVVSEKITAAHGDQPDDWALHGTTGYRYGMLVNGLFVDRRQARRFERIWRSFSGVETGYEDLVTDAKRAVALGPLGAELTVLATQLKRIANTDRHTRDYGFSTLRDTIADTAASMPVYRTYVVDQASAQDRRFIDWAIAQARKRSAAADTGVFDFLRSCLLAEFARDDEAHRPQVLQFAWRFQQFCAPVAAKGVEDTAFYRYHRLISLNEVGGDPATFGTTVAAFHGASSDRCARWPHTMLATSTHDNKRSEDVRNRIDVLSEVPGVFRLGLRRWHLLTRSLQREVDGRRAPSPADEYLLYQTLLGSLPAGELDDAALADYRERVAAYMTKAAREAKRETSWMRPNAAYEEALLGFTRGVLGRSAGNPALNELRTRATELARFGGLNSFSMALLKYSSPGVPDIYQGNETIDLSLVDPDNRRPVDYAVRDQMLDTLQPLVDALDAPDRAAVQAALQRMAADPADGRLKLWTTWRLLELRRRDPPLFENGDYLPLKVHGKAREHIVAYARRTPSAMLVVVAARLYVGLLGRPGAPLFGEACWGDTTVDLTPLREAHLAILEAQDVLSGQRHALMQPGVADSGHLRVAELFASLPGAALYLGPQA
ncbi:malto-oligosyltrehalose synthase [Rhodoferax koreense]|uniref:Malto-oligosyltrehalose synthase n=1 Tax=Rhodoferax koreensis TaxID=1842727 RepID=A0A1P8JWN5_9BURK|nr:malto-oligosyltrehalose synthase [Rhodoferax koreense]APW38155.1 malto-oligosyltrehalose synthase [Rhodoferax koreense]